MPGRQQHSRQDTMDLLKRLGYSDLADKAEFELPDPVDLNRLEAWCVAHGLPFDYLENQMGGGS
jgi:hypothetical protein